MVSLDEDSRTKAKEIITNEISVLDKNHFIVRGNGCAACHVLFALKDRMQVSEQDAADLLSEVLLDNDTLNDQFITMVEDIHMKDRMMGVSFAIKNRESKLRYIDSNFKNVLNELLADASNYGVEIVLRKLIVSNIALAIAQNLGIDYHAATEELYYYMRKNDFESHKDLMDLIRSLIERAGRTKHQEK